MLKNKGYNVNVSNQSITYIAEIYEMIIQFYLYELKNENDRKIDQISLEKLGCKIDGRITEENVVAFLQKMNTWRADSFNDFIEATRLLFGDESSKFKRVNVSDVVSYYGLSRLTEEKNRYAASSFIFQLINNNTEYHPLIRCGLFTWIMLKHPIFENRDVNLLMAGVWQNVILLEWKPILNRILSQNCFWMMGLISDRRLSRAIFVWDVSKFTELNLMEILKILQKMTEFPNFLPVERVGNDKINASSTVDCHHERIENLALVVNSSQLETKIRDMSNNQILPPNVQILISKMIEGQEYSINDLLALLEMKHRGTFSKNYLGPTLDLSLIKMTIPDKPTSKNQKYVLKLN